MPKTIQETREQTELFFRESLGELPDICFLQEPDLEIAPNYDNQLQKTLDTIQKMLKDRIDYTEIFAITQPILNRFFLSGPHAGRAIADVLMDTKNGKTLLLTPVFAPDEFLIHAITASTLNALVPSGPLTNHSIAFSLAKSQSGRAALAAHDSALLNQITPHTLNAIISSGCNMGQSVALALANNNTVLYNKIRPMVHTVMSETAASPPMRPPMRPPASVTDEMLNLFKSKYSHLNVLQFYKIWHDEHQGPYTYYSVLSKLQEAGLVPARLARQQRPSAINSSSVCPPPAAPNTGLVVKQTLPYVRAYQMAKLDTGEMLNIFKSHYSHLKAGQFYKIWRSKHQGTYSYSTVLNKLQKAGLIPKRKPLVEEQPPSTMDSSSICSPPLATVKNFTDNDNGDEPSTKKMRI